MFLSLRRIVEMTEYFTDIEQARNITEIKEIFYLISKRYSISLTSVFALMDDYQGKYRHLLIVFIKISLEYDIFFL